MRQIKSGRQVAGWLILDKNNANAPWISHLGLRGQKSSSKCKCLVKICCFAFVSGSISRLQKLKIFFFFLLCILKDVLRILNLKNKKSPLPLPLKITS